MSILLAVPSEAPGGRDADLAGHFGHCAAFSLFGFDDGRVVSEEILPFGAHEHGDCLVPVQMLAKHGVTAMVAHGMGARPLAGFLASGIQPFFAGDCVKVADVVAAFARGELLSFSADHTCAHHHDDAQDSCHH